MSDLRKAAEMALEVLEEINKHSIGEKAICLPGEIDDSMEALRQALAQPEQEPTPLCWGFDSLGHAMLGEGQPFYPSGQKVSLSVMKPGDKFILTRTGQIYSIKENGAVWNETEQRAARLHKNCQVEPLVTHPKCDDACMNICTEGFAKSPNCTAPPKREWVGLTDDDKSQLVQKYKHIETGTEHDENLIAETEAKLKEKNT